MLQNGRYIRIGTGIILGLIILGYGVSKSVNLLTGPEIEIESLRNGETVRESLLNIKGLGKNAAFISLNDKQIFVDDKGNMTDQILLYEGYNIITVKAKDKFGGEKTVVREIIYLPYPDNNPASIKNSTSTKEISEPIN